MAEFTQNYNLKKPAEEDFYNVKDFNDNADIIDQALKSHDDALATKETPQGAQEKADAALNSAKQYTDQEVAEVSQALDAHKTAAAPHSGHETPAGAQAKANTAETNAKAYTDAHEQKAAPHSGHETPAGAQAKVDAHAVLTTAHSATSAATANRIMMRDANGRAKVAAPSASDDIARKDTVDNHATQTASLSALGHVKHAVLSATLNTTWSGSSAPYSKTVTVSGILATDNPIIDIVMSGTYSTDEARIEAWGYIYRAVTANDSITFYATEKPTVSLPIQIRVVR